MKSKFLSLIFLMVCFTAMQAAEPIVKQNAIAVTNADLRNGGNAVVVSTMIFDAPSAGRILLRFDGYTVSDSADRIVLAASDKPDWGTDDGNVALYAPHSDFKRRSFSHTRVYDVAAGLDTFYAVAQNYVVENGSGIGSVYGHLTLEFFPAAGPAMLIAENINYSGDVRSAQRVVQRAYAPGTPTGKAVVHIDGYVYSDPGDRIVLSAANVPSWLVGDGSVAVRAYNSGQRLSPYAHSRLYTANSSLDTLYAVCRNVVESTGSGIASVYGNLSVEYFPTSGLAQVFAKGLEFDDLNARGNAVALDSISITTTVPGFALAQLDGYCTSQVGDEMLFAVNDNPDWDTNEGHVTVSAPYNTNKFSTISHSRVFSIPAGTHTFYSVVENTGKINGNGLVDILANFSVKFFADPSVGIQNIESYRFGICPNPTTGNLTITLPVSNKNEQMCLSDLTGRVIRELQTEGAEMLSIDINGLPKGIYLLSCNGYTQKVVKE